MGGIKAILTNLTDKGYLKKVSAGRNNLFSATLTAQQFKERTVEEVLNALSDDYLSPMLSHLVDRFATSSASLNQLEELIAAKRAELKEDE